MSVPGDLVDARGIAQRYGIERSTAERIMRKLTVYRVPGARRAYVSAQDVEQAWRAEAPIDEARIERAARAVYPHLTGEEWDDERFAFVAAMAREIAQDALAAADQEDTDA